MRRFAAVLVLIALGSPACSAGASRSQNQSAPIASFSRPSPHAMPFSVAASDEVTDIEGPLRSGHAPCPADVTAEGLPPGHPPVDLLNQAGGSPTGERSPPEEAPLLAWRAPERWQSVPNTNAMRLATYRVPGAPGDDDAELSVVQAGGSVSANAARWMGQFDEASRSAAKVATRKVGVLDVTVVEVQGNYAGGMGMDRSSRSGWAMRGAIVPTAGMPFFFKLTGPVRSVSAASAEFDVLIGSLVPR